MTADRGSELYEDNAGNVWWWKRCEVPGCGNMVCIGISPIYCWPHAMSEGAPVTRRKERTRPKPKENASA